MGLSFTVCFLAVYKRDSLFASRDSNFNDLFKSKRLREVFAL